MRAELADLDVPPAVARLPQDRGYPVPWFVQWFTDVDEPSEFGEGRPDFRVMDGRKLGVRRSPR
jgi:hypothetical protein